MHSELNEFQSNVFEKEVTNYYKCLNSDIRISKREFMESIVAFREVKFIEEIILSKFSFVAEFGLNISIYFFG